MKVEVLTPGDAGAIDFASFVGYRPGLGTARIKRQALTSPEIFDMEMRYIFEVNWIYLCHDSQIPSAGDFFTTTMGRQPVEVSGAAERCGARLRGRVPPVADGAPQPD
jgi:hypothetical protein